MFRNSQPESRVASWVGEQARRASLAENGIIPQAALPKVDTPTSLSVSNDGPISGSKRIAIIGGGISGFAAYWSLRKTNHCVELFEQTNDLATLRNPVSTGEYPNLLQIDKSFINFFQKSSR